MHAPAAVAAAVLFRRSLPPSFALLPPDSTAVATTPIPLTPLSRTPNSWWHEYTERKNDEGDMVADSLLYDERCHLPRTAAGPRYGDAAPPAAP